MSPCTHPEEQRITLHTPRGALVSKDGTRYIHHPLCISNLYIEYKGAHQLLIDMPMLCPPLSNKLHAIYIRTHKNNASPPPPP